MVVLFGVRPVNALIVIFLSNVLGFTFTQISAMWAASRPTTPYAYGHAASEWGNRIVTLSSSLLSVFLCTSYSRDGLRLFVASSAATSTAKPWRWCSPDSFDFATHFLITFSLANSWGLEALKAFDSLSVVSGRAFFCVDSAISATNTGLALSSLCDDI